MIELVGPMPDDFQDHKDVPLHRLFLMASGVGSLIGLQWRIQA